MVLFVAFVRLDRSVVPLSQRNCELAINLAIAPKILRSQTLDIACTVTPNDGSWSGVISADQCEQVK